MTITDRFPGGRWRLFAGIACVGALTAALALACWSENAWVAGQRKRPVAQGASRPAALQRRPQHASGKVHFDILAKLLADDRRSRKSAGAASEKPSFDASSPCPRPDHPLLGQAALDFTLPDHRGQPWNLREQLDRGPVVLVFYLGYACDACVHHLFELNADSERFDKLGAAIVAVSGDSPEHTRARFAEFGAFAFPVLSDPDHRVARSFAAEGPANSAGQAEPRHATLVIACDATIAWGYCGGSPWRDSDTLLRELARLKSREFNNLSDCRESSSHGWNAERRWREGNPGMSFSFGSQAGPWLPRCVADARRKRIEDQQEISEAP